MSYSFLSLAPCTAPSSLQGQFAFLSPGRSAVDTNEEKILVPTF